MKIKKTCKNCFWSEELSTNALRCDAFAGKFGEIINSPNSIGCHRFEAFKKTKVWYFEVLVKDVITPENVKQRTVDLYRRVAKTNADNPRCKVREENMERYNMTDEQLRQYISNNQPEYVICGSNKSKGEALQSIKEIKEGKAAVIQNKMALGKSVEFLKLVKLEQQESREVV